MNPLETYLTELREIRDSGAATKEISGYGTLAKLLDAVGHTLKPKVHFVLPELKVAVSAEGNEDSQELLNIMVEGKRLRDISDLPLDLAI